MVVYASRSAAALREREIVSTGRELRDAVYFVDVDVRVRPPGLIFARGHIRDRWLELLALFARVFFRRGEARDLRRRAVGHVADERRFAFGRHHTLGELERGHDVLRVTKRTTKPTMQNATDASLIITGSELSQSIISTSDTFGDVHVFLRVRENDGTIVDKTVNPFVDSLFDLGEMFLNVLVEIGHHFDQIVSVWLVRDAHEERHHHAEHDHHARREQRQAFLERPASGNSRGAIESASDSLAVTYTNMASTEMSGMPIT